MQPRPERAPLARRMVRPASNLLCTGIQLQTQRPAPAADTKESEGGSHAHPRGSQKAERGRAGLKETELGACPSALLPCCFVFNPSFHHAFNAHAIPGVASRWRLRWVSRSSSVGI